MSQIITDEIANMRAEFEKKLAFELERLRAEIGSRFGELNSANSSQASGQLTDRRGMLKKVGALGFGIAAAGLLRPNSGDAGADIVSGTNASPDANGDAFILGQSNSATNITRLTAQPSAGFSSFEVRNADAQSVLKDIVIAGVNFATQFPQPPTVFQNHFTRIGVYGGTDGTGSTTPDDYMVGVAGSGMKPTGSTGRGIGVLAVSNDIAVFGSSNTNSVGVGVAGTADGSQFNVGVVGTSNMGLGGAFRGSAAAINLDVGTNASPNPNVTAPNGGDIGDLFRTPGPNGELGFAGLWFRTTSSPGSYRRLADQTTAGSLTLLSTPLRLIDTRTSSGFFDAGDHFSNDTLRTYNIGTIANGAVIAKATAILGRVTVVNANATGALQISPNPPPGAGNDLGPGTAVINFPAANVIAAFGATFVSRLDDSGQVRVHVVIGGGSVDVIIDVLGYFI
jgi:hypothetical protein